MPAYAGLGFIEVFSIYSEFFNSTKERSFFQILTTPVRDIGFFSCSRVILEAMRSGF